MILVIQPVVGHENLLPASWDKKIIYAGKEFIYSFHMFRFSKICTFVNM